MKFFKNLNKIINRDLPTNPKTNLFRTLTYQEKQAVELYDFRDISTGNPNNNVIITCEHASNETHKYKFPRNEEKWLESHWGYDIGSKDMGLELSEKAEIMSIFSNFSRLLIDPNRTMISSTLIRKHVEKNIELSVNRDEVLDEEKRIEIFYLPYYRIMKEALNYIQPKYALSIHSFTKQYEDNPERKFEVGILFREKTLLVDMIESAYKKEGVSYRLNEPYKPEDGVCFAMDAVNTWNWPHWSTDVVLLEFRNDYCSDPAWRKKQVNILSPIINELKNKH
jgi:predicted N-formylglutamate amidohydrolase